MKERERVGEAKFGSTKLISQGPGSSKISVKLFFRESGDELKLWSQDDSSVWRAAGVSLPVA